MSEYLKMPWSEEVTAENLKSAKEIVKNLVRNVNLDGMGEEDAEEAEFDFNRAIEALEKQIPKEIIPIYFETNCRTLGGGICNICGGILHPSDNYCPKCGQAVSWPDRTRSVFDESIEKNELKIEFNQASVFDNDVLMNANPEYIKQLEALPEHKKKAHLYGDWNVYEGQVFE